MGSRRNSDSKMARSRHARQSKSSCGKMWVAIIFAVFLFGLLILAFMPSSKRIQSAQQSGVAQSAVQVHRSDADATDAGRAAGCRQQLSELGASRRVYSVVFDVGSTGSRVHVFRFKNREGVDSNCVGVHCLELEAELFEEDHNPLSKIKDPAQCVAALEPLHQKALDYVPQKQWACTLMEVKATAGLRKIGKEASDQILSAVRQRFSEKGFWMRGGEESCRIMDGKEEGPMAWITVNFLLHSFDGSQQSTAGVIDVGGGSTQLVFEPTTTVHLHPEFRFSQKVGVRQVNAYQHSYDGYGLHEGTQTLLCRVAGTCSSSIPLQGVDLVKERTEFACFPQGYQDDASSIRNDKGAADFTRCTELFTKVVLHPGDMPCSVESCGIGQVFQPPLRDFNGHLYAFSFVYDLMKDHFDSKSNSGPILTLNRIAEVGKERCSAMTAEEVKKSPLKKADSSLLVKYECLYYSYVYALLSSGYGVAADRPLYVSKKIDGFETAWPLGAALTSLSQI